MMGCDIDLTIHTGNGRRCIVDRITFKAGSDVDKILPAHPRQFFDKGIGDPLHFFAIGMTDPECLAVISDPAKMAVCLHAKRHDIGMTCPVIQGQGAQFIFFQCIRRYDDIVRCDAKPLRTLIL